MEGVEEVVEVGLAGLYLSPIVDEVALFSGFSEHLAGVGFYETDRLAVRPSALHLQGGTCYTTERFTIPVDLRGFEITVRKCLLLPATS